ncbi:hypothetical protein VNO77_43692 [Canavalia gladiata]|uniref:Uncharacterized protein n=1 Tax=Canavalia gladiata TaxID=3824 RepID=A0AAN9PPN4_CANGL
MGLGKSFSRLNMGATLPSRAACPSPSGAPYTIFTLHRIPLCFACGTRGARLLPNHYLSNESDLRNKGYFDTCGTACQRRLTLAEYLSNNLEGGGNRMEAMEMTGVRGMVIERERDDTRKACLRRFLMPHSGIQQPHNGSNTASANGTSSP